MALQIMLEDFGGTSFWASIFTTLSSSSEMAQMRFVGRVKGDRRYKGATFACPRSLGVLPPQEEWAPGMTQSLEELCREVESDGWVRIGLGAEPWAIQYQRPPNDTGLSQA